MEKSAAVSVSPAAAAFVRWEEVYVSTEKGRREVHYYLKLMDGTRYLAVMGKEKSIRHMSYHIRNRSLLHLGTAAPILKLKSRREVVDWLDSVVEGSTPHGFSHSPNDLLDSTDTCGVGLETFKDNQLRKLGLCTKEFLWLGSASSCKKRRKHYQSFRRNGVQISVHDFVYVLAEEDKRLVAYLEDMYEDTKGNKMVVVRWFHKIDEVGFDLPHNFNDREIFFSLCLQDLSIECIDGLATVLSRQHFVKFQNEATHTQLAPFVCLRQFENDDVMPFDITQLEGYWKQEILRYMYTTSSPDAFAMSQQSADGFKVQVCANDAVGVGPSKRCQQSSDVLIGCGNESNLYGLKDISVPAALSLKEATKQKPQYLTVGSQVEVLSQDSGIRGCWFRALIIKKHKDKVKVRYEDIQDADDEANNLEEWLLASRVAAPDELGLRICGRRTIRPRPQLKKGKVSWVIEVGTIVDVWWNDGWWEGIVIRKESEDGVHVYFPGEKKKSIFGRGELRHSQEWFDNSWKHTRERPDLVSSILSTLEVKQIEDKESDRKSAQSLAPDNRSLTGNSFIDGLLRNNEAGCGNDILNSGDDMMKKQVAVPDLLKDDLLARLKWRSRKRRRGSGSSPQNLINITDRSKRRSRLAGLQISEGFLIPASLKVDHENCKYIGDSFFGSSVVPPLTSLVMSM